MSADNGYEPEGSIDAEFEEGEIIQDAELICVGQEDLERLAAEGFSPYITVEINSLLV